MLVAVFLVLIGVAIVLVISRSAGRGQPWSLVHPILLDDALDADLRELRAAVREDLRLKPQRRRALCRMIIELAAEREEGQAPTEREQALLQAAWEELGVQR